MKLGVQPEDLDALVRRALTHGSPDWGTLQQEVEDAARVGVHASLGGATSVAELNKQEVEDAARVGVHASLGGATSVAELTTPRERWTRFASSCKGCP